MATAIWSEIGNQLATISTDLTARVWDIDSGKETHIFHHSDWLTGAVWLSETQIYLSDNGTSGIVWDLVTGETREVVFGGWVFAFSPDRDRIAAGRPSGIAILDAKSLEEIAIFSDFYDDAGQLLQVIGDEAPDIDVSFHPILAIEWQPDGDLIASGDTFGSVKLREAASGKIIYDLNATDSPRSTATSHFVMDLAFSEDGTQLHSIAQDGTIRVWDVSSGRLISEVQTGMMMSSATFSKALDELFYVQYSVVEADEIMERVYDATGVSRISLKQ